MQFLQTFAGLFANFGNLTWQMVVMWGIGGLLIYLAIAKKMEPSLLAAHGLRRDPRQPAAVRAPSRRATPSAPSAALFEAGMSNELFPLLLFIGIGAMIDFGPLLEKPWLMLFGAAAQFGIFCHPLPRGLLLRLEGRRFHRRHRRGRRPHGHLRGQRPGHSQYLGAIMVAAYSYMALVPIVQPPVIRLLHHPEGAAASGCRTRRAVSARLTKILFPIVVTMHRRARRAPASVALVGFLMFGNLLRECGVLNALSETRAERPRKPHHDRAGPDRGRPDDRRQVRAARHSADPCTGPRGLCV